MDLNVEKAWLQGITGEGIIVGVVDDGEWVHLVKLSGNMLNPNTYAVVSERNFMCWEIRSCGKGILIGGRA